MKASEVLTRYAAGERNFKSVNLRGEFFKGQNLNLSEADFSNADIRGVKFIDVTLHRTKFTNTKAGTKKLCQIALLIFSWLMAAIYGFLSSIIGVGIVIFFFSPDSGLSKNESVIGSLIFLAIISLFFVITLIKDLVAGFAVVSFSILVAIVVVILLAGAVTGIVAAAVAAVMTIAVSALGAVAVAAAEIIIETFGITVAVIIAVLVSIQTAIAGINYVANEEPIIISKAILISIMLSVAIVLLSAYIGWRSIKENERDIWIYSIAISFAAIGATSFQNAKLIDADFTKASLKSTDFREANLTRTCWRDAQNLDRVRPGQTYLKNALLRQLLTTGIGQNQNFDYHSFSVMSS
ncbi:MAG: hypothetical protein HC930_13045 [Hydrococcus sp. SU_1_0]|nr:hypothetical protein [Hydrococcus sp. SU_1_0]